MNRIGFGICLIAVFVSGCSSRPPREIPPEVRAMATELAPAQEGERFLALPKKAIAEQQNPDPPIPPQPSKPSAWRNSREQYEALSAIPPAGSRVLRLYLGNQTFDYFENGELFLSGPIASGKAGSATPTGRFSVLSKDRDKESSLYTNEVGTQAWMPYSLQSHGNYFIHEGWLPGYPASHGCIRVGHHHARLLFERMKIGDPVTVTW